MGRRQRPSFMANSTDIQAQAQLGRLQSAQSAIPVPRLPEVPVEVKKRFPSMSNWERNLEDWRQKLIVAVGGVNK